MTGSLPTARMSPTAGLVNAMARLYILRTAASFRETKAAGYIDLDLEWP
ncbi:hypothetical protein GCM10009535_12570 [Streptomyces thermocarboxydovorans]|jgi:hypothetical protein|uniref:Uncharacterized protein n=1 Tax=Streptomyces thermocarboxydovorans TaxID=59298 RepID=A0ABN1HCB9_9ACTN